MAEQRQRPNLVSLANGPLQTSLTSNLTEVERWSQATKPPRPGCMLALPG